VTTPRVLGIGGSTRALSSSEAALRLALAAARDAGAEVDMVAGPDLVLPIYEYGVAAGALIIASPGYHGSISGMMKNALDYIEELRTDSRVYCDGMAVGCIAVADGWQAAVTTLQTVRSTVHALRGWPTPLGAALNNAAGLFAVDGSCSDDVVTAQLTTIGTQVVRFAAVHGMQSSPR
jgi:FMN reductase